MKTITVLLADDHTLVREGLRLLIQTSADIQVVGEAANGHESVRETKKLKPDVVLQDIAMPMLNGLEAARQIAKEVPSTKVLIVSAYTDEYQVERAIEAGASGYFVKGAGGNDLLQAIREIAKGNAFFSPPVAKRLWQQRQERFLKGCPVAAKAGRLTSRQTEVLQLIAEGYASKQIAGFLLVSIKTVEKHRQELMNRLNMHTIATLTRYAVSTGVVESNRMPTWPETPPLRAIGWVRGSAQRRDMKRASSRTNRCYAVGV